MLTLYYNKLSNMTEKKQRKLYEIAKEIRSNWKNVYFGAEPYLKAMESLSTMDDYYLYEDAKSIVIYFLANAQTWRGEVARRVKKELNEMCNG